MADRSERPDLPPPPDDRGDLATWFRATLPSAIPGRTRQNQPTVTFEIPFDDVWRILAAEHVVGYQLHVEVYCAPPIHDDLELAEMLGLET